MTREELYNYVRQAIADNEGLVAKVAVPEGAQKRDIAWVQEQMARKRWRVEVVGGQFQIGPDRKAAQGVLK